ncbi:hypothetical protein GGX14DRAFT_553369 [Mycena pura]|uniref:Fungal-type protein kinase domain-containing protein n=1 Tax=Mycena pura TaxID=153505 RepID=A0AAD7E595_9AGAR|nr:hypothetical protein GGX14DRAFT_553369 [Mycena pura]
MENDSQFQKYLSRYNRWDVYKRDELYQPSDSSLVALILQSLWRPPALFPQLRPRADTSAGPPTTTRSSEKRASNSAKTNSEKEEDTRTQCASYALELLTYGGLRSHVLGALVTNHRSAETAQFVNMLKGGVLTHPFGGSVVKLNDGRSLIVGGTIFQSHGIIGRGTCVSQARMEVEGREKDVIVKWSWPAKTRTPEANLVKIATELATASGDCWVLDHLPKILRAEEREFDENSPHWRLSELFWEHYRLRVLRIVLQERLYPITELTAAPKLSEAFHGIYKCYRWLFETAGIDGKVYGVLNDFDLSVLRNKEPGSTSKQRIGTEPYTAVDLLVVGPPPPHPYRFDLESLFYVVAYVVCQYHEGKKIDNPPFQLWDHLPTTTLRAVKQAFLSNSMTTIPPTSNFLALQRLTLLLHKMFHDAYNARTDAQTLAFLDSSPTDFKDDTVDRLITFDKFEKILVAHLPSSA